MGSIISISSCTTCLTCFTCEKLTNCACKSFGIEGDSLSAKKKSKFVYLSLMTMSVFFAVILQYSISPHINIKGIWDIGCDITDKNAIYSTQINNCKGSAAVYRISFMSTVFYLFNTIGCLCSNNFHGRYWFMKLLFWFTLMISSIFIPNYVFGYQYEWFSRIISFLFLIAQISILIDFSYSWNDRWVAKSTEIEESNGSNGSKYIVGLLLFSTLFYLISVVGIVLMYMYFGHCETLTIFITITLVGIIIFTYLQLFNSSDASLLSSSIVSLYCTWLCISSITSYVDNPDIPDNKKCNIVNYNNDNVSSIIIGAVIAGLSLAWTSFNSFQSISENDLVEQQYVLDNEPSIIEEGAINIKDDDDINKYLDTNHDDDLSNNIIETNSSFETIDSFNSHESRESKEIESKVVIEEKYYIFHMIMMIASIYMGMLLTDWGTKHNIKGDINITGGQTSMWIKITSQWITMISYSWTLVARRCLSNRNFD